MNKRLQIHYSPTSPTSQTWFQIIMITLVLEQVY